MMGRWALIASPLSPSSTAQRAWSTGWPASALFIQQAEWSCSQMAPGTKVHRACHVLSRFLLPGQAVPCGASAISGGLHYWSQTQPFRNGIWFFSCFTQACLKYFLRLFSKTVSEQQVSQWQLCLQSWNVAQWQCSIFLRCPQLEMSCSWFAELHSNIWCHSVCCVFFFIPSLVET